MSIQEGFAVALRLLRKTKGLAQKDLAGTVAGSHISQLENDKTSPTIKIAADLAQALHLSPSALLAVAEASDSMATPREVLMKAISNLEEIGLLDAVPPASTVNMESTHPTIARAAVTHSLVQKLKIQGLTQVDAAKELGLPKSTVQRHWH